MVRSYVINLESNMNISSVIKADDGFQGYNSWRQQRLFRAMCGSVIWNKQKMRNEVRNERYKCPFE